MKNKSALVFYNYKQNKYSFTALTGVIETDNYFENLKIYFIQNENDLFSGMEHITREYNQVFAGISFFTSQLWEIARIVKLLKKKFPGVFYIAGGPHPSGNPQGTINMGFDIVVLGEGEETLPELLRVLDLGNDLSKVKGIAYIDTYGRYHFTGQRQPVDLNKYPPVAVKHRRVSPVEITRGCSNICYFCQTPRLFGATLRHRSIESICKYISIMKNNNLVDIRFVTPNAFLYGSTDGKYPDLNKLEELLRSVREIVKKDGRIFFGSFPSEVRPEHVNENTIDLVLKYADNDNLVIGAQSGSQRILDLCHRGHTVEDVYHAVRLTINAGLKANVDFIFGLPGEQEEDIKSTIEVMEDLVKMGAKIHAHTFMPLPGTPYAKSSPGRLEKDLRKVVKRLVGLNKAFGSWEAQEKIASKIMLYLAFI
jgi:B12-binding domain/radical SAM domain protein